MANPLLREPLAPEHIKPRLLGHWGTTPGLNILYTHLSRLIARDDARHDVRDRSRPRRSGDPRELLARRHLLRDVPRHPARRAGDGRGCSGSSRSRVACRATSRPRPPARSTKAASSATRSRTRSAPRSTTPTSSSRASSVTARPRPVRSRRAGTRTSSSIPSRDGAVLPILHLNGYKIANPTVLARITDDELDALLRRARVDAVPRRRRRPCARPPAARGDARPTRVDEIRRHPTSGARESRRRGPAPLADDRVAHAQGVDRARRSSTASPSKARGARTRCRSPPCAPTRITSPARSVDALVPARASCSTTRALRMPFVVDWMPKGARRMCANPHANGGVLLRDLDLPDFRDYAVAIDAHGATAAEATRVLGTLPPRRVPRQRTVPELPPVRSGRDRVEPPRRRSTRRPTRCGRPRSCRSTSTCRRTVASWRSSASTTCQGWLEGYLLTGRHGFFSCYEAFTHIVDSMFNQHAKWLKTARSSRGAAASRRSTTC